MSAPIKKMVVSLWAPKYFCILFLFIIFYNENQCQTGSGSNDLLTVDIKFYIVQEIASGENYTTKQEKLDQPSH
jgi:hypothetical protein